MTTSKKNILLNLSLIIFITGCGTTPRVSSEMVLSKQHTNINSIDAPTENVCHLKTSRRNFRWLWTKDVINHGSAALIDGRYIVTAAHNLADYPFNSLVRVDVTCGERMVRDDLARVSLIGRRSITNQRFVPRYTYSLTNKFKKFRNDYAFLDLGKTITESLSLTIPIQPKNLTEGTTVFLAGYPGGDIGDGNTLFIGSGAVQKIIPPLVSYGVYSTTGNSGGPLWIQDNDQKNYLVGVHVYSSGARYIDHTFLTDWKNWIETRQAN